MENDAKQSGDPVTRADARSRLLTLYRNAGVLKGVRFPRITLGKGNFERYLEYVQNPQDWNVAMDIIKMELDRLEQEHLHEQLQDTFKYPCALSQSIVTASRHHGSICRHNLQQSQSLSTATAIF